MKRLALLCALAGCTSFEDPDIVLDLRVLAMTGEPPEQLVDLDPSAPFEPTELLAQLVPSTMCALVADPRSERRLRWELALCLPDDDQCNPRFRTVLRSGVIDDPDTAPSAQPMCATVEPNANLLGILLEIGEGDPLAVLGGIDYFVELRVRGEDDTREEVATKSLRVSPRIPAIRTPNTNPTVELFRATLGGERLELPLGRCAEQASPLEVAPGTRLTIEPIELPTTRETYVVPTLDGRIATFTESPTYQWRASAGGFSRGGTGGTRDNLGNLPELDTEWRAPARVDGVTDVQLWFIVRDERLGATWYESCVRVVP